MGGEENALTLPWLPLGLIPREPCLLVGDQSPLHQVVEVVLADRRADLVALDPARRQAGSRRGSAPAGPLALRIRGRLLRALQCHRLLFPHGDRSSFSEGPVTRAEASVAERSEEEEKRMGAHGAEAWSGAFYKVVPRVTDW